MSASLPVRLWYGRLFRTEIKATFFLALPLMLGQLSSMLMGVVGTMMAGRLGATALAASGIVGVVFAVSMLLVWGSVRMVPTPVAEAHELRNGERVKTLVMAGMMMGLTLILVSCMLLTLGIHFFDVLKQDPEVAVLAKSYLKIMIYSLPVLVLYAILVNLVDAFSYVRITMVLSFVGLGIDILLNWLFMFGRYGLPKMGIDAIAMNTGISHAIMAVGLLLFLLGKKELHYIRTAKLHWSKVWKQTTTFIQLGFPSAMQMLFEFAAFGAGTIIIGQISKTEQAAHQIALNLVSASYVTIMGVSTAGMIRIGQALAYNSKARVWTAGVATLVLSMAIMLLPAALFLFFPKTVVGLYISDASVVGIAISLMLYAGLFQLADAAQAASISLLRALSDIKIPALLSFCAFWVVGLPLGYWLAVPQGWNAKGIWMGYLVALILQAILFGVRFFTLVKQKRFHVET